MKDSTLQRRSNTRLSPISHTSNIFLHDIPTPTSQDTKILSYANDITITSTHVKHNTAATNAQYYLNALQTWLTTNRLKVAPEKSTATLITNYKQECNLTPVTLYNASIPYTNKVKILGVTYDNGLTFKDHIADFKLRCTPKLRAFKAITVQDFGQSNYHHRQTVHSIHCRILQWIHTTLLNFSDTHYNTLQIQQNNALRTATVFTKTTPIDHLHQETKTLKIRDHMDLKGTQFYDRITIDTSYPLHHILHTAPTHRNIRNTPSTYYTGILDTIQTTQAAQVTLHCHV